MKIQITKDQAVKMFREDFAKFLKENRNDFHAKVEAWHNWTDMMCKNGIITEGQYNRWSVPFTRK